MAIAEPGDSPIDLTDLKFSMNKLTTTFHTAVSAVVTNLRTIIVWAAIIVLIFIMVKVNSYKHDMTVQRLSSSNPSVQDDEIMSWARQQKLADALADIQDPNSPPDSDANKADTKIRVACATEFTKLVTKNALPADIAMANLYDLHKDGALKGVVTAELATLGKENNANLQKLVSNLGDGDPDVRGASSDALAAIGGPNTVALLVAAVGVSTEKDDALTTLGKIGKPAAPSVVAMLATANPAFTQKLIDMLATIGDAGSIPAIKEEAATDDPATRRVALLGLSTIIISNVPASPLTATTAASKAPVAVPAKPAPSTAPVAAAAKNATSPAAVVVAAKAPPASAAPATAPSTPPGPTAQDMANCLSAGPILTAALNNPNDDSRARAQCALALGRLGTSDAIIALIKALGDIDNRISQAATNGLAAAGPTAIPMLASAVHSPTESVRIGAATALGSIGTDTAVSAMAAALTDSSPDVRRGACEALSRASSRSAVSLLAARLSDPDGFVAGSAASSLQVIGKDAVPALVAALGGSNQAAAFYSMQALSSMGVDAAPQVRVAAQSGSDSQKVWSAVVLGQIHDVDSRALLTSMAADRDPKVQYAASQALQQLGGAPA